MHKKKKKGRKKHASPAPGEKKDSHKAQFEIKKKRPQDLNVLDGGGNRSSRKKGKRSHLVGKYTIREQRANTS